MSLCRYSGVFGEPNTGAHAARVGETEKINIAKVDLLATAGGALLIAAAVNKSKSGNVPQFMVTFVIVLIILLLIGGAAHELFCVNTRLNAYIFNRSWPGPHPRIKATN